MLPKGYLLVDALLMIFPAGATDIEQNKDECIGPYKGKKQ